MVYEHDVNIAVGQSFWKDILGYHNLVLGDVINLKRDPQKTPGQKATDRALDTRKSMPKIGRSMSKNPMGYGGFM